MPRVGYRPDVTAGFRPFTNPRGALRGLGSLGDFVGPTFPSGATNTLDATDADIAWLAANENNGVSVTPSGDLIGTIQSGSQGIFQAALPWMIVALAFVFARKR